MLRKAVSIVLATTLMLVAGPVATARTLGTAADPPPSQGRNDAGPPVRNGEIAPDDLGELIYLAAQTLADRAGELDRSRPIIVTTMVSIDDLGKSSTFGRLASELISNRLTQRGYLIKDVTYMRALAMEPSTGAMVLSRDASRVSTAVDAQAVVVGTYAVGGQEIFLNIRLLKAVDGEVLSSADVEIPLNRNTWPMVTASNITPPTSSNP